MGVMVVAKTIKCPQCGRQIPKGHDIRGFCSCRCLEKHTLPVVVSLGLPSGECGAVAELIVCADLLSRGFVVFRSVSPSSPYDLVCVDRAGEMSAVEVTTGSVTKAGKVSHGKFRGRKGRLPWDLLAVVVHRSDKRALIYYMDRDGDRGHLSAVDGI